MNWSFPLLYVSNASNGAVQVLRNVYSLIAREDCIELRSMDEGNPISNSSSLMNIMRYEAGFAPILLQTLASSKRRVKNDKH